MKTETTTKLAKFDAKTILAKPEVKAFNDSVAKFENAGRFANVSIANAIYVADNDGTTKAMGLDSAADFLIQVRGYSRSAAYNLQRVGRYLQGTTERDLGGNVYSVSAILEMLTAFENDADAVHKFIASGKADAFTSVRKMRNILKKETAPAIAADAESKEVDSDSNVAESDGKAIPNPKNDPKPYNVDMAIRVPDGKGGEITYKSKNGQYALSAIVGPLESLAKMCNNPDGKIVVTITPVK